MSTATLQQSGQSLPSWLDLVRRGETVAIMDGGLEVARLVPPQAEQAPHTVAPVQWPDFAARRRAVFGDAVLPAGTAQTLVDEDRISNARHYVRSTPWACGSGRSALRQKKRAICRGSVLEYGGMRQRGKSVPLPCVTTAL